MANRLYVSNLPSEVRQQDITDHLKWYQCPLPNNIHIVGRKGHLVKGRVSQFNSGGKK
jgi:hypothetical protein